MASGYAESRLNVSLRPVPVSVMFFSRLNFVIDLCYDFECIFSLN